VSSTEHIVHIEKLVKIYKGASQPAVDHIDLDVIKNEILGLLGPNGAGKTTTIHILCGLLEATSGSATIGGFPLKSRTEIKKLIGFVPQDVALFPSLTAWENLSIFGTLYGLRGRALRERIDTLLEVYGLNGSARKTVDEFSGGMKRRLNIIAGILHAPTLLFLDEPTTGLDVQSRNLILENLRQLNQGGTTIVYTSHYLEEAEEFCSRVAIIDHGRIIGGGHPKELIASTPGHHSLESIYLHLTGKGIRD
jgi:ABC-2 type transport system ATP-binding protein